MRGVCVFLPPRRLRRSPLGETAAGGARLPFRGRRHAVFVLGQLGAVRVRSCADLVFSFLLAGCAGRLSVRLRRAAPLSCQLASRSADTTTPFSCSGSSVLHVPAVARNWCSPSSSLALRRPSFGEAEAGGAADSSALLPVLGRGRAVFVLVRSWTALAVRLGESAVPFVSPSVAPRSRQWFATVTGESRRRLSFGVTPSARGRLWPHDSANRRRSWCHRASRRTSSAGGAANRGAASPPLEVRQLAERSWTALAG